MCQFYLLCDWGLGDPLKAVWRVFWFSQYSQRVLTFVFMFTFEFMLYFSLPLSPGTLAL